VACDRHPLAVLHGGLCPACLLEAALATPDHAGDLTGTFTIQVPLGERVSASVFLVRTEAPERRLLRLKVWRWPAPPDFLDRFRELRQQLGDWRHPCVALPLAAYVDATGRPAVLTEFRQGIPIMEAVGTRVFTPRQAVAMLRPLVEAVRSAHARGLAHGSMGAGNVIAHRGTDAAHLLDFGLTTVASPVTARAVSASADRAGLAALLRAVRTCEPPPAGHTGL
jgi:serine/threonine protein kinase